MYLFKFTDGAREDVRGLPKNVRNSLRKVLLDRVAKDPNGCSKSLNPPLDGFRSFSWHGYRIVYRVSEDLQTAAIAGVGERNPQSATNIYTKLENLAEAGQLAETVLATLRGFSAPKSGAEERRAGRSKRPQKPKKPR